MLCYAMLCHAVLCYAVLCSQVPEDECSPLLAAAASLTTLAYDWDSTELGRSQTLTATADADSLDVGALFADASDCAAGGPALSGAAVAEPPGGFFYLPPRDAFGACAHLNLMRPLLLPSPLRSFLPRVGVASS